MRPGSRLLAVVPALALATACGTGSATPSAQPLTASPDVASSSPAPEPTAPEPTAGATSAAATSQAFDEVPALHPSVDDWEAGMVEVRTDDGAHRVAVRVAVTPEQRQHGLMEVPELPDGAGMWFPSAQERTGGFWMKNTLVPLDIVYVDGDDHIVSVADAEPCTADPCPVYDPEGPYHHVLEVPGGWVQQVGAAPGDVVVRVDG